MALPNLLIKLFQNEGAGPLLRDDIISSFNYSSIMLTPGSSNWIVPHTGYYDVWIIGGGGGSGAIGISLTNANATKYHATGGAGAGGGAYARLLLTKNNVIPITVGAGGTAGVYTSPTATEGGNGGTSSFGTVMSAYGGEGSVAWNTVSSTVIHSIIGPGANGGTAIGGSISIHGGNGNDAHLQFSIPGGIYPGAGGVSPFINYQPSRSMFSNPVANTQPAIGGKFGSGASGPGLWGVAIGNVAGAKGGDGVVIIQFAALGV